MGKVNRSVLQANDQKMGDLGDPDKLELSINHLADIIDENDNGFSTHKSAAELDHPDKSVTQNKLADGAVSSRVLANSSVLAKHLDSTLLTTEISTQAEFDLRGINLRKFGVKGDGITDDYPGMQAAIDYCVTNKITELLVPEGVYYVTQSIDSKGIKIKGLGTPYIPFLTWDYTRPNSVLDRYTSYKNQCTGPVITTDKAISIFSTGLEAENIGLFGNLRAASGSGVSHSDGRQYVKLRNCTIKGFKEYGINAPYGVIYFLLDNCTIDQNGKNGVYVDKNLGTYTGETNIFKIINSKIRRNESHGIVANLMGRSISITGTSFESNGEPSDSQRAKPTSVTDTVFGAVIALYNKGSFANGSFEFSHNYSEETYGLMKLNAVDPSYGMEIKRNLWKPYDDTNYSCFLSVTGWIYGLSIKHNDVYTTKDYVRFESGNNIKNVEIDIPYTGLISNNSYPTQERARVSDKTFANTVSNDVQSIKKLSAGMAKVIRYDSASSTTYIDMDSTKISGSIWDGYDMGPDANNKHIGMAVKVGGNFVGVIKGVSSSNRLLSVRGDRSSVALGDGSVELVRLGGFETLNGAGQKVKLVVDWDGTVLTTGK